MKSAVASDAARMLTRLLPSRSAPISRSLSSVSAERLGRARLAAVGQRVQLAAAGGGQRGLRPREERREQQQHQDRARRPPEARARGLGMAGSIVVHDCRYAVRGVMRSARRLQRRAARRAGASPAPARAAAHRAHGCRSRWWRCWHGRAASGSPAGRRRGPADGWRRRGAACAARPWPASSPASRARSLTSRKKRSRVMWPRRPRAGKRMRRARPRAVARLRLGVVAMRQPGGQRGARRRRQRHHALAPALAAHQDHPRIAARRGHRQRRPAR